MPMHFLTDEEVSLVQWAINEARRRKLAEDAGEEPDIQTGDTYIALTPAAGIPALYEASGSGSGSSPMGTGDTPGSAVCQIYQIVNGKTQLLPSLLSKTVYNLSPTSIAGFTYIVVSRDKFGRWVVGMLSTPSFLGHATQYIAQNSSGVVTDVNGTSYTVYAPFGSVNHGVSVWVEWDSSYQRWTAIQVPCPSGTATGSI